MDMEMKSLKKPARRKKKHKIKKNNINQTDKS